MEYLQLEVQSFGTAKRAEGDTFAPMLNIQCEAMAPDEAKIAWLYTAQRAEKPVRLGEIEAIVKGLHATGKGTDQAVKVNLTVMSPSGHDVQLAWRYFADKELATVAQLQGELPGMSAPPAERQDKDWNKKIPAPGNGVASDEEDPTVGGFDASKFDCGDEACPVHHGGAAAHCPAMTGEGSLQNPADNITPKGTNEGEKQESPSGAAEAKPPTEADKVRANAKRRGKAKEGAAE